MHTFLEQAGMLKPRCELSADQVIVVSRSGGFMLKAVLKLQLDM